MTSTAMGQRVDTEKLRAALRHMSRGNLLSIANRAIELVPRARLGSLVAGIVRLDPRSAHLGEAVAGCCRSGCDMRPRDQPPQHWREIWRLIERMSAEDFRAFFIQGAEGLMHLRYCFPHLAYSFADEQQILGIDLTCMYEATCLLGTPAGVCLVHQSALVVHKIAQVSPRTGQALSKVVGSDLQHLS